MLYDTIVLAVGSSIQGSATPVGTAFPSAPVDGQKFRLTAATATHEIGEYTFVGTEWTNALVQLAKNANFNATGKIGSGIGINTAVLTTASGIAFPASPTDGQKFRLTAATTTHEAGEYTFIGTEWTNSLVQLAKNANFTATGKIGSAISINSAVLTTATGTAFPGSPTDGQKFRLTAATATYEIGEYTYSTSATEWTNALVELAKNNTTFSASGKKGSNVVLNSASSAIPYDIGMQILGKPDAGSVVGRFVAVRAFKLPINFVNSIAKSGTAALASTVLSVKKNGTQVGTVTFAAGATNGTFVAATEVSFAIGDIFTLTAAATQDTNFADAQVTFVAALA